MPWVASMTVLGEGGKLKDWMLQQPVRTKGWEFCWELNYCLNRLQKSGK